MVDVLCERTSFSNKDASSHLSSSVIIANFRRMKIEEQKGTSDVSILGETMESLDLFHCVAGLYASSLPDMELEAIYSTLMKPAQTIVAIATKQDVLEYRAKSGNPSSINNKIIPKPVNGTINSKDTELEESVEEDPYHKLFSDSDSDSDDDGTGTGLENENQDMDNQAQLEQQRHIFLEGVKMRQSLDPKDPNSVGLEDRIIGCITVMQLSSKPKDQVSQILLLAVRHRWRGYKVGGYLIKLCMDPSIVGQYEMMLTYADHKAESFFSRYGFTDDPIVTARHRKQADYWENSTLMAYIPPYSDRSLPNSFKSMALLDQQLKEWRTLSMAAHCDQVCIMERLKQEILLLVSRVTSQQEVIDTLHKELRDVQRAHRTIEVEYEMYRLQTQSKLVRLMQERARSWITQEESQGDDDGSP